MSQSVADDTNIWRVIEADKDREELPQTMDNPGESAGKWGMQFNKGKCKVTHIGNSDPQYEYMMNGQKLRIKNGRGKRCRQCCGSGSEIVAS